MNTLQFSSGCFKVTRNHRTSRDENRVIALLKLLPADVDANVHSGAETSTLRLHLGNAAVDVVLLHLEIRDAVSKQPADLVVTLKDCDCVASPGELLGGSKPCWARADNSNCFTSKALWN